MNKYEALAVVEIKYFTYALEILDYMTKAANVTFLSSENYLGGRLVTIVLGGDISEVTIAIEVAKEMCESKEENPLKMALVITNPHKEVMKYVKNLQEELPKTTKEMTRDRDHSEENSITKQPFPVKSNAMVANHHEMEQVKENTRKKSEEELS